MARHPLSVAPMMDRTDRHFRWFMRQITRRTLLYTEMVTTGAVLHGDREVLLGYDPAEHPIALQLGGDDPEALATCARIAEDLGYDEVNLNVGCPSDRVQKGCFGAVLMKSPERVAACVEAMKAAVSVPVTVKHRIGVDDLDRYEDMLRFVTVVSASGADRFSVHARKAWLQGLSPKENRNIPPLRYDEVHRLKAELPHLEIEINGGILDLDQAEAHLAHVDAVMIGRAAVDDPWIFADADRRLYGEDRVPDREDVARAMVPYIARVVAAGGKVHHVTRHMLHLFRGMPGARGWRRALTEGAVRHPDDPHVVTRALDPALNRPAPPPASPAP
ncbi:MAG: tRNA dihydrouridine(20/20a) synthase DusA [Alphaproteobacteria bacterium]|nr:tRNA dihydrouridine(20/20a) synthase DusA [Alphaproteobacteria bacterium]